MTIYHGDAPPRFFAVQPGAGETPLARFFEHLLANYEPRFTEFVHYVDEANERCAATFLVTLTPKPDSPYRDAGSAAPAQLQLLPLTRHEDPGDDAS